MTSMPVMDKNSTVRNILSGNTAKTKADSISGGFGQYMKQSGTSDTERAEAVEIKEDTPRIKRDDSSDQNRAEAVRDRIDKNSRDDMKSQKTDVKEKTPEELAEEQSKVMDGAYQMMAAIAQELGVTQEEVQQVLNQLELPETALLTQDGVKNVMIALTEGADQMSLLTDESLYQSVNNVLETLHQTVGEISQSMGKSLEQFDAYLQEMMADLETKGTPEMQGVNVSQIMGQTENSAEVEQSIIQTNPETAKTAELSKPTEDATKTEDGVSESQNTDLFERDLQKQFQKESGHSEQHSFMQNGFENPILQTQNLTQEVAELESAFQMPDTQEIMDQIMDYMKIQMKPEMTNLEMQLHPESLGTLHIQISSKEGVMTAQFTTQNVEVKAVLESQMMELKTNLEQQGIKVEAVEVTIAEYNLNQQFSNDTSGQNRQMEEQKKGRRVIRIEDLDTQMEELSPEDKLTAEMMQSEGTTVNYTA